MHRSDAGSAAESTFVAPALLREPLAFRDAAREVTAVLLSRVGTDAFDRVEDAVQDAFAAAARAWPLSGPPAQPLAWLHAVARRRYLDRLRADRRLVDDATVVDAAIDPGTIGAAMEPDATAHEALGDEQLRLLFMCCHPALSAESRVALTLKCVSQLSVPEIARALRADPVAVAQRLVRAKRTLREHRATFELPDVTAMPDRTADVLAVAYALFADGHYAADGDVLIRDEACAEARRLVSRLASDARTATPEVHALEALLHFSAARMPARAANGEAVPLAVQDRSRWDRRLVSRGVAAFSQSIGGPRVTRYHLEAEIALLHTTAPSYAMTPWRQIVNAYDRLLRVAPTPMARLARVVALVESGDGATAERELEAVRPQLEAWPEVHAVDAELAWHRGDLPRAERAFAAALALPNAAPVRSYLERRRTDCLEGTGA